jgi:hypothetical protein
MLLAGVSSPCLPPALVIFEKLVGRNCHDDLSRLIFDEGSKREHCAISHAAEQANKDEKSEQTRHDQIRQISV